MSIAIERCRICGNPELEPVIDLGEQALTGIFPRSAAQAVPIEKLELVKCGGKPDACGLVQLRHSCDPALMYGSNYGYRSGLNPSMVQHLSELARDATARLPLSPGDLVLDIGSNDGTLLRKLAAPGVALIGMDPSADKFRQFYPAEAAAICDLFSAGRFQREYGSRKAKIITSIAMFYDLESPLQFMREVAEVLADDGIWVFEQSYLPAMIDTDSFDTICHEHLEYYALAQIQFVADRSGLRILDVSFNKTNGGSFRVTAAHAHGNSGDGDRARAVLQREESEGYKEAAVYSRFRDRVRRHRDEIPGYLREARRQGQKVFGYGASTKGNVVLQYCGITTEELPLIAEVNPDKFGCFTPKSLIPIVSEEEARAARPDAFFVLPWHFREFIVAKEHNFLTQGGRLIFPLPVLEAVNGKLNVERVAQ
jgi:NDP-4-keto-2,6-dideoxyhexose 3-C-methyltransferase